MKQRLIDEIIARSKSKIWEKAKEEWAFKYAYESEPGLTCLCGHTPITNICVIKNKNNQTEVEVGNCCIKKFLHIEEGEKIFASIKKLKADRTKSMGLGTLRYLYLNSFISKREYNTYKSTVRKKRLSALELCHREQVNLKLLNCTNYESGKARENIVKILEWAKGRPWFTTGFFYSLRRSLKKYGHLTERQRAAIENIMSRYGI